MTAIIEKFAVYSEYGNPEHPSLITVTMDGSKPDCPITFWSEDKPVFSMGSDEIDDFIKQLNAIDPR